MICDACNGTGVNEVPATYKSNWHGEQETKITQPCYKCKGSGQVPGPPNDATGFSQSTYQQQTGNRSRDLEDDFA